MNAKQRYKEKIKERIRLSNYNESIGQPADPWVVQFRAKNNSIKAKWKSEQPDKPVKKKCANSGSFKKGLIPVHKLFGIEKEKALLKSREMTRNWHKANKEKVNNYRRLKRATNTDFRLKSNLRKRLSFLLRKSIVSKTEQTMDLLGCSIEEFKNHLSSKFSEGMTFENYGEWHIDHIRPCDSFDFTIPSHRAQCFHYTNMQPLWATENLRKSNKINHH